MSSVTKQRQTGPRTLCRQYWFHGCAKPTT
jgi:hypothetical protein